jgi:hypothetical protein
MKYLKTDIIILAAILLGLSLMVYAGEPIQDNQMLSNAPTAPQAVR